MPWASGLGISSTPVLCYHNLGGNGVPRQAFAEQMRWLARQGARSLTLAQLADFIAGQRLNRPGVLITFDDGFRDLHTFAGPLLADLGLNAVVFAIADRLRPDHEPGQEGEITAHAAHRAFLERGDRSAWCSGRELARLAEQGVMEIGGHGLRHAMGPVSAPKLRDIPDHWAYTPWRGKGPAPELAPELAGPLWLDGQGRPETGAEFAARAEDELAACRRDLEAATGQAVTALAWPWGRWHPLAQEAARRAGFTACFTLERGPLARGADPMRLPRLEIRKNKGMAWFRSRLAIHSRRTAAAIYSGVRL